MDDRTIDEISISKGKTIANVANYFGLFDKYLPMNLTSEDTILILGINNPGVIREIIMKNPVANYVIFDEDDDCALLQMIFNKEDQFTYISANKFSYEEFWAILEYNKRRKCVMNFKHIIMNPPWGDKASVGLGRKILRAAWKFCASNGDIVCLYGNNELFYVHRNNRMDEFKHCDNVDLVKSNDLFDISSRIEAVCCHFTPSKEFTSVKVKDYHDDEWTGIYDWETIPLHKLGRKAIDLVSSTFNSYNELIKVGNMTELSTDQFEYFENKLASKNHANSDVPNSKYKFILNRTSYENTNDPYYDVVENSGGITWTCKTERIKNNMRYWLHDCPLVFMWRKYFLTDMIANCSSYKVIPRVNFDMDEAEFKEWADNLADGFGKNHSLDELIKMCEAH